LVALLVVHRYLSSNTVVKAAMTAHYILDSRTRQHRYAHKPKYHEDLGCSGKREDNSPLSAARATPTDDEIQVGNGPVNVLYRPANFGRQPNSMTL